MSTFVRVMSACVALGAALVGGLAFWRRNPRVGTNFVNSVVNPVILRRELAGGRKSELGTLEHVGRRSGVHRFTPVHPEPTVDGFRVVVPLGPQSEWARNVVAAGRCRLQLHDHTYELVRPEIVRPTDVDDLPRVVRRAMDALGFQYLKLRTAA
jgi:deazaflavin-dependent oxidoreductase (nitroreductase family)